MKCKKCDAEITQQVEEEVKVKIKEAIDDALVQAAAYHKNNLSNLLVSIAQVLK